MEWHIVVGVVICIVPSILLRFREKPVLVQDVLLGILVSILAWSLYRGGDPVDQQWGHLLMMYCLFAGIYFLTAVIVKIIREGPNDDVMNVM